MTKLAIIIGGTKGIGKSISMLLSQEFDLALIYKDDSSNAQETLKEISATTSKQIAIYKSDVTDFNSSFETYNLIKKEFKTIPYVLIYAAGISRNNLFIMESIEAHRESFNVNYFGALNWCKLITPDMSRNRIGKLIALSSNAVSINTQGLSAYSASKLALEKLFTILGGELATFNITANIVRPGIIQTEMSDKYLQDLSKEKLDYLLAPSKKLNDPMEIAKAVKFLIDSNNTNSSILTVDSGHALYRNI